MSLINKLFGNGSDEYLEVDDIYARMGLDLNTWENKQREKNPCFIWEV